MPTDLSTTPLTGILNPGASSGTFSSPAGARAFVRIVFAAPQTSASKVFAGFTAGVVLQKSTDSGSTWSTVLPTLAEHLPSSSIDDTGRSYVISDATSALYQVQNNATNCTAIFAAYMANGLDSGPYGDIARGIMLNDLGASDANRIGITTAKLMQLMLLRATPLGASDISGSPLTLYKRLRQGSIAKLSVPSDALRDFDPNLEFGANRSVRVSKATVVSLTNDRDGSAFTSEEMSFMDPHLYAWPGHPEQSVVYAVGSTIVARDLILGAARPFAAGWGITGFTTLLEAAMWVWPSNPTLPPSLTALGL